MLRTLIIDDEPHVRKTLTRMVAEECPEIRLVGEADGVESGLKAINDHHPDLVLLDIKMDDGTGFDLLRKAEPVNFRVIFITAYDQYAIQAVKYSAIDYLLKPVDPVLLAEAVQRAVKSVQLDFSTQLKVLGENLKTPDLKDRKILLKTNDAIFLVRARDISYCESDLSYTKFYLQNGQKIMVSNSLHEYEELLKDAGFYRVHRSFLVNLSAISRFEKGDGGFLVMENNDRVPVSSRKKDELMELFHRLAGI